MSVFSQYNDFGYIKAIEVLKGFDSINNKHTDVIEDPLGGQVFLFYKIDKNKKSKLFEEIY